MVLSPEHPFVERITTSEQRRAVNAYCAIAAQRSDMDRTAVTKEKTGVATGAFAINPVNGERIPIWVADYVLITYGTGAIMAVPGHDTRDFVFARQFKLPIRPVMLPPREWLEENQPPASSGSDLEQDYRNDPGAFCEAFTGAGTAIHSGQFDGLKTAEFKKKIVTWLEDKRVGKAAVNYKLRDWLFSRQRYWGEPFPILHGPDGELVALDESELPVALPDLDDFRPRAMAEDSDAKPEPPLGRAKDWVTVERDGKTYTRELNTMPQWAGSCWYYLRFLDAGNDERFCGRDAEKQWMVSQKKDGSPHVGGIDLYLGGAEHAVLHLLYARFWHKVLYDLGHVSTIEPFGKLSPR